MLRRRWLVRAPTRRIQIGWKIAPKMLMIFFSLLLCCWLASTGQLCQSCWCKEKVRATPVTKSWEKVGKLFEKLGIVFKRQYIAPIHTYFSGWGLTKQVCHKRLLKTSLAQRRDVDTNRQKEEPRPRHTDTAFQNMQLLSG